MKNKKNVIIVSMLAIVAVMAIGYSYFATRLNINATGNITTNWNVYFSNITNGTVVGTASNNKTPSVTATTATMDVNLALPGDSMTYELTLTNGGTIGAIIEDIKAEAKGSSAIIYSISGLKIGDKLVSGASKTITIKIEYDPNTTSQPALTSKTLTVTIDAVQDIGQSITESDVIIEEKTLAARILKENTPQSDSSINFSQATNGQGLYYTNTNTEDNKTTYYFRGDVDNNYVSFGANIESYGACMYNGKTVHIGNEYSDYESEYECLNYGDFCYNSSSDTYYTVTSADECNMYGGGVHIDIDGTTEWVVLTETEPILWRIVRINEDGSIRLITQDIVGSSDYNYGISDNAAMGFMYGTPGSDNYEDTHANENDSDIKEYLDNWYTSNLSSYSSYLADAGFCNDRSVAPRSNLWYENSYGYGDTALGYGQNSTYYGAYNRIQNLKQPQFACPNPTNDLFTLKGSSRGNKALDNPIGLLTLDEVVYAGHQYSTSYLSGDVYWMTMTPWYVSGASFYVVSDVAPYSGFTYSSIDFVDGNVRPVINLKADVEFTLDGTGVAGSSTNPYIIKTN